MKKAIAFFDFDGTITTKDTLLEIVKYCKGSTGLYAGLLKLSPWLAAMKLKLTSNQFVKEKFLTLFFKDTPVALFQQKCDVFAETIIPQLIRPAAIKKINEFKENNIPVVIVSASPENWIAPWCRKKNLQFIATLLEVKDGHITGNIQGANCYGTEKVKRISASFDLSVYEEIFCFGDTKGDKPMLALATSAYYKPFR
ncbi:MAG: haloacid dehalogenase-like hydrolase [Bacteroidetes bacterium]|nr:haloacid dehalogenase-like hydrolase [Bacteroidota bacterium]